jgi:hypothetical protein
VHGIQVPVGALQPSGQAVSGPNVLPVVEQMRLAVSVGLHSCRPGKQKSQRRRSALHKSGRKQGAPTGTNAVRPWLHAESWAVPKQLTAPTSQAGGLQWTLLESS